MTAVYSSDDFTPCPNCDGKGYICRVVYRSPTFRHESCQSCAECNGTGMKRKDKS